MSASVAVRVGRHAGLEVVSGAEVRRIADLAAERTVVGCDTEACLTELAGAIGAQYVVFGEIGRVDDLTVITLGVLDPTRAAILNRETLRGDGLKALLPALDGRVDRLLAGAGLIEPAAPSLLGPVVAVGGGLAVVAGGVALAVGLGPVLAYNDAADRVRGATSEAALAAAQDDVQRAQRDHNTWGLFTLIGGGVAVVVGVVAAGAGVALLTAE